MKRIEWEEYFLELAKLTSERASCVRTNVGAIIVRDNRVLSTGYNGTPEGFKHCDVVGCLRDKENVPSGTRHELCRGVHAEQNASAKCFSISR